VQVTIGTSAHNICLLNDVSVTHWSECEREIIYLICSFCSLFKFININTIFQILVVLGLGANRQFQLLVYVCRGRWEVIRYHINCWLCWKNKNAGCMCKHGVIAYTCKYWNISVVLVVFIEIFQHYQQYDRHKLKAGIAYYIEHFQPQGWISALLYYKTLVI
jgi:hypothetical protein